MTPNPKSGEIRKFIIDTVEEHPRHIARVVGERFGMTRQAVNRHLTILVEDGVLEATGQTRKKEYALKVREHLVTLPLAENRDEDKVWRAHVGPHLTDLPDNVLNICHYGFTEMFNNAIDHSEGTVTSVYIRLTAKSVSIRIVDNGVGIFEKIKTRFNLDDHRQAILELSKGKLTTDPKNHSGQGIFFTSRMFDKFYLKSGHLLFTHNKNTDDWLLETEPEENLGTGVRMGIDVDTRRTAKEVFDRFADPELDDYEFSRTHVPLALAKYGRDNLISRSQAKRVLARFESFKEVILDFQGIEMIGQGFADEIFRVFSAAHPDIEIETWNANEDVRQMIQRAVAARRQEEADSG